MKSSSSSHLSNALLLLALGGVFLFYSQMPQSSGHGDSSLLADQQILSKLDMNATGHVYPYTATLVSLSCLLAVIMIIICMGSNL